ncbi:hypothetical protein [uncultured Clostridium sp.]|uniref:hypothetical protein n=1 Tax=uncultured Clostridium sp. TaxID=59620 RepID=UPI0026144835|nr:hypothetical protein [uncultured Clostridium sp.]
MLKMRLGYENTKQNKKEVQKVIEILEKDFEVIIRSNLKNNRKSDKKHFINIELETKK